MSNENRLSTAGEAPQVKQPWVAPVIEVLDLSFARHHKSSSFTDAKFKS
jgi:hypothetical protein